MQPRVKILLAYLLILGLGLAISITIFISGRQVTTATNTLLEEKLPRLQIINQLYLSIIERERLLYEYYATTDTAAILPKLQNIDESFSAYFQLIANAFPDSSDVRAIDSGDQEVRRLTQQLDNNFQQARVDWDGARAQLVALTQTGRQILPSLDNLVAQVNQQAFQGGEETRQRTELSTQLVISFSIFVIIIAAFVGYYVNSYIAETISRRRLAMFAERSPNPIFSFNWQGELTYSNPASLSLIKQQNNYSARVESLLPDDFQMKLLSLQKSQKDYIQWQGRVNDSFIVQYSLSLLRDLDTCQLYIEDITQRTLAEEQLKFEAYHDVLTELPNRRYFAERLEQLVTTVQETKPLALILIQLDRFELITSSLGYKTGDLLLVELTKKLDRFCHNFCRLDISNQLYRLESNKFALVLNQLPEHEFAENLAKQLQQEMNQAIIINDSEFHLSLTIGISHYPNHGQDADTLLANADAALTRAKLQGDGLLCYSLDIQQKEQAWIEIERELRQAIEKQQLQLYFQPKIKAQKHQISGVEALIRWQKDDGQMVSPAQFIPVAEQTGLIITIGDWVLEQAIKQAIQWQKYYTLEDEFTLAINLSAKQFQHPDFIDKLSRLVENHSLNTSTIELEITESLLINDINQSIEIMHQLKAMGFKLSIDDFGTGYSSLSYLKQFPIDKLKIDRAFVMDLEVNQDDKVLAKSIIDLAHNLNLSVVAEGVENQTQLTIIEQLGAEEIQGFYFSKPLKPEDLELKYWLKA